MDRGVQILYGKNVAKDGFSEEVDMRTTVTRIVPQAYNGRMIRGERPWVDSELIGKYPAIYTELMKFPDIKMRMMPMKMMQKRELLFATPKKNWKMR